MPKITRFNGNLQAFASQQQVNERTLFGQTAIANDLTSQVTAQFLRGWGIVGPSDQPSLQDFNAAMYTSTQLTAYLHQMGIPEFNAAQEYYSGSVTQSGGAIYISLQDGNTGRTPASNPTWWRNIAPAQATEAVAGIAKIATSAIAQAGTNDTDMMTPVKTAQAFGRYGLGREAISTEVDLNNYTTAGLYVTPGSPTNAPPGWPSGARAIVYVSGGSTYVSQIVVASSALVTYMAWRNGVSGTFSAPWRVVAGTDSPALTGAPTSTTPPTADNSTRIATTAHVQAAISARPATDYLNTARADVAQSGGVLNLFSGIPVTRNIRITASGPINSVNIVSGQVYFAVAAASFVIANSASIVTNTGADISVSAGDSFIIRATGTSVVEIICGDFLSDKAAGIGQSWSDVTASRAAGTTYTNTTTKPIEVVICGYIVGSNQAKNISVDGVPLFILYGDLGSTNRSQVTFTVKPGSTYAVINASATIQSWAELR